MALGLSNNHERIILLNESKDKYFMSIAHEAINQLGWNMRTLSENTLIAYTKTSFSSFGEEVSIKLEGDNVRITSACTSTQLMDWGKNRRNIDDFLSAITKIKANSSEEDLENKTSVLPLSTIGNGNSDSSETPFSIEGTNGGFISAFIPREGYFVTPILIYANIIIFLCMLADGANVLLPDSEILLKWGANFKPITLANEWWRLLSSCFVHIGIIHILLNLYALVFIGRMLEPFIGMWRFLTAYLLTGLLASLASLWWHDNIISAGASGAIFGMYGVFLAFLSTDLIEKATRKAFLTSIGIFVAYNLFNGIGSKSGIDNAAHIGGLLSGFLIGFAYVPSLKKPDQANLSKATSGILVLAVLAFVGWFCFTSTNDIPVYEKRMQEFAILEEDALQTLSLPETTPTNILLEKLRVDGIDKWKQAYKLIESCDKLKLPAEIQRRNWKLMDYCDLRIASFEYVYKAVNENTTIYQSKLDSCNVLLENIVSELTNP